MVDGREFKTPEDLFNYLQAMPKSEYEAKVEAIKKYLLTDKPKLFSCENFVKIFMDNVLR